MLSHKTQQAIRAIVNNYCRQYKQLDRRDLEQEATLAALQAARTWKEGSAPLHCYQARAVTLAVGNYCARARCPVSGWRHDAAHFATVAGHWSVSLWPDDLVIWPDGEGDFYRRQLAAEIRRILYGLADGRLAALVLLAEYKPAEVARRERCKLRRVYRATHHAYQALAESAILRDYAEAA